MLDQTPRPRISCLDCVESSWKAPPPGTCVEITLSCELFSHLRKESDLIRIRVASSTFICTSIPQEPFSFAVHQRCSPNRVFHPWLFPIPPFLLSPRLRFSPFFMLKSPCFMLKSEISDGKVSIFPCKITIFHGFQAPVGPTLHWIHWAVATQSKFPGPRDAI